MKIFLIEHDKFNYDAYSGHVIVANNENEVRELAKKVLLMKVRVFGIRQL